MFVDRGARRFRVADSWICADIELAARGNRVARRLNAIKVTRSVFRLNRGVNPRSFGKLNMIKFMVQEELRGCAGTCLGSARPQKVSSQTPSKCRSAGMPTAPSG